MISKKASMELGISTVVVLVIAMVIIAGGIAFIRGFFKLGEEKLGGAFNVGDFGVQPTSVDPLVMVDGSPSIKTGKTESVKVGYYNRRANPTTVTIQFTECVSTVANTDCLSPLVPIINSLSQTVEPSQSAGFENFVAAKCKTATGEKSLAVGDYICTISAYDSVTQTSVESKQITLAVES